MRKFILLLIASMLLSFAPGCEQKPKSSQDMAFYNLTGPVKSVVIRSSNFSEAPSLNSHTQSTLKITFNQSGNILNLEEEYFDNNGDTKPTVFTTAFIYDEQGRLEKQIRRYDTDNAQEETYLYRSGMTNPYASIIIEGRDKRMTHLEHSKDGLLLSAKTLNEDLDVITNYEAKYNTNQQLLSNQMSYNEEYIGSTTFAYDKNGFTLSKTQIMNGDKSLLTYEYLKTDEQGNWIERKVLPESEDGYAIEKREISYY